MSSYYALFCINPAVLNFEGAQWGESSMLWEPPKWDEINRCDDEMKMWGQLVRFTAGQSA